MQDLGFDSASLQLVLFSKALSIYLKTKYIKDGGEYGFSVRGPKYTWASCYLEDFILPTVCRWELVSSTINHRSFGCSSLGVLGPELQPCLTSTSPLQQLLCHKCPSLSLFVTTGQWKILQKESPGMRRSNVCKAPKSSAHWYFNLGPNVNSEDAWTDGAQCTAVALPALPGAGWRCVVVSAFVLTRPVDTWIGKENWDSRKKQATDNEGKALWSDLLI